MSGAIMPKFDAYHKKRTDLHLSEHALVFDVSQSLFSSHQVDVGTVHLLKALQDVRVPAGSKILDLGCGYGPIGLTLSKLNPSAEIHMVDRDALAVAFAQHNAHLNDAANVSIYGSLGFDNITPRDFDLIASNIPGKAGDQVITTLLHDARHYLSSDGSVAIVVVSPLTELVSGVLAAPDIEILEQHDFSAHTVYHYRFQAPAPPAKAPPASALARGIYDREEMTFVLDTLTFPMRTAKGLPEFDTLSYETEFLIKVLRDRDIAAPDDVAIFNVGQGHIPVVAWRLLKSGNMHLVDRDLLSLTYARDNLLNSGCPPHRVTLTHRAGMVPTSQPVDLVLGILREDEGPEAHEASIVEAAEHLRPHGQMFIAGGSTPITRILKSAEVGQHLRTLKRKRSKGRNSVAVLQRK